MRVAVDAEGLLQTLQRHVVVDGIESHAAISRGKLVGGWVGGRLYFIMYFIGVVLQKERLDGRASVETIVQLSASDLSPFAAA